MAQATTAVAPKQAGAVAIPTELKGSWGAEGVDGADLLIPRLLLMQPLSKPVIGKKAAVGDIIRSTNKEVVGGGDRVLEFIPLSTFKTWIISEKVGNKFEFRSVQAMTPENRNDELTFMVNGKEWRRDRALNFYVLLPTDINRELQAYKEIASGGMPDPDDALLPAVLSFQRTSYLAGKELATHFQKADHFNLSPAVSTFKLTSELVTNDQGSFHVFRVLKSRKTSMEELGVAKRWYDTLQKVKVKVDEAEDEPETATVASPGPVANERSF